jgi:hypothetical protein
MLMTIFAVSGCARLAGRAAGEAVEQPLRKMTEEDNLANLEQIMTSPEVARSTRDLGEAAATGIVAGLTGPESQRAVADMMNRSGVALRDDLGSAVSTMVRETIDETMKGLLAEEHQASVRRLASDLGEAHTAAMMRELGQGLEQEVVPAMIRSFEDQVSPALVRELRDPELREALGTVARELAHQTVMGTNAGIAELATGERVVEASDFGLPGRRLVLGWAALVVLMVGLGVTLVTMVVLLAKGAGQRRHLEEDSRRREAMLMALVQSTLMHDATPEERREMLDRLRAGTDVDFEAAAGRSPEAPTSEKETPPRGLRWRPST